MRMILEVFRVRPPLYIRQVIYRQESKASETINDLIAYGDAHQDDKEHIYYHIIFPNDQAIGEKKEASGEQRKSIRV